MRAVKKYDDGSMIMDCPERWLRKVIREKKHFVVSKKQNTPDHHYHHSD